MAIEDLLIPAAIIVLLLAMGGSGEPGPPEEKREELTREREAWGGRPICRVGLPVHDRILQGGSVYSHGNGVPL